MHVVPQRSYECMAGTSPWSNYKGGTRRSRYGVGRLVSCGSSGTGGDDGDDATEPAAPPPRAAPQPRHLLLLLGVGDAPADRGPPGEGSGPRALAGMGAAVAPPGPAPIDDAAQRPGQGVTPKSDIDDSRYGRV